MAARPWCLYYVQGDEGESAEEPNAFQVPVSSPSLTVKQLLSTFPLDKGATWHFRFRVKDDRYGYVWQDVRDLNAAVPLANGVIYAKVLRLDRPPKPQSRLRRKPMVSSQGSRASMGSKAAVASPTYSAPPPPPPPQRRPSAISSPSVNNDSPSSRPAPPPAPQPRPAQPPLARVPSSDNTSSFLDTSAPAPPPKPPAPPAPVAPAPQHGDDLDSFLYGATGPSKPSSSGLPPPRAVPGSVPMAARTPPPTGVGRVSSPATQAGSPGAGFMGLDGDGSPNTRRSSAPACSGPTGAANGARPGFGMDIDEDTPSSTGRGQANGGGSPAKSLFQEFMESKSPTSSAKEEKAAAEAKEEEALDGVKARVGPKLDQWANDPSTSKLRNVRTLLSTMHTVLWEGATWKALFLGDLMAPDRVKFHYRKAMLLLHPDKNVNGSVEQRYIAERVFTCVNDAYQSFAAQELK